jgi:hypothetical protein
MLLTVILVLVILVIVGSQQRDGILQVIGTVGLLLLVLIGVFYYIPIWGGIVIGLGVIKGVHKVMS